MPLLTRFPIALTCGIVLCAGVDRAPAAETNSAPALPPVWERFLKEKLQLEETLAKKHNVRIPESVRNFFAAAQKGHWVASSNLFYRIVASRQESTGEWVPELWGPVNETFGVYELFHGCNPEFMSQFGVDVAKSVPAGSVCIAGTAWGRYLISVYSESHSRGLPFFTITQNALADPAYLGYLRDMYGGQIRLPDTNAWQKCVDDYVRDATARLEHDEKNPNEPRQLRPGESVSRSGEKLSYNNQVSVMAINASIAKVVFDLNPTREFYCEESFPLDWMYPHLTPHRFILKVNRASLEEIPGGTIRADREFWTRQTDAWLGSWLNSDTTVRDITQFAERVFVRGDLGEFKGNPRFIRDAEARRDISKLRCSIAGLYVWRADHAKSAEEQRRMRTEADFAFRQALAICPDCTETVFRYASLLTNGRVADALLIGETALKLDPDNGSLKSLVEALRNR